ncbi:helix-turn-helix transcriptional regulator [Actinoplanes sp. NBRC 103695]|uniref:helix-turn-helix transcriptional regulator n=1 Tax=Actinoplanes sp. NBRC 103695 TaxID=3032202 RepID=UPI0024A546F8|nr:helix-turn-helix transcriptional regulator [Actinoplanes sp. NBRC 103695]GLZ02157.1 AraC family transcriptional regulator [Actinoplanes sp. NBRC 103695]
MLVHSLPAEPQPAPCASADVVRAGRHLSAYVLGYATFRSGTGAAIHHRVLPVAGAALVIDLDGHGAVLTGPRARAAVAAQRWGRGVTAGLTPAGVRAVFGMPMGELAGATVPFEEAELVERLAAAGDDRLAILDGWVRRKIRDARQGVDPRIVMAWARLQRPDAEPGVGVLAARLGIRRRLLEQGFRQHVGIAPGAVARIARLQRAIGMLAGRVALARVAADCGYADQPHLTRDVRAMCGCTPGELRRHLHLAQSFKTPSPGLA